MPSSSRSAPFTELFTDFGLRPFLQAYQDESSQRRFYLADDWTAKKLEVLVDIPDKLQLEHLRARGLQPGDLP